MTPLDSGGQNGGAGLVATALVRRFRVLAPSTRFTLLTADVSHAELAALDAENVERRQVALRPTSQRLASRVADHVLPPAARAHLKRAYRSVRSSREAAAVIEAAHPDLLFCPFTEPRYWQSGVPCVSIVYDLQHLAFPEFFTPEQRLNRQHHVQLAVDLSSRVACISDFVRQTLVASVPSAAGRAVTIPLAAVHPPTVPDPQVIERLGLRPGRFVLYPANFWPHKNHARLFEALALFRSAHPALNLRLVCTGAPTPRMRALAQAASPDVVTFAGYLTDAELMALLEACAALIYPSLYEGFGLPILEAMAAGKPVLCSDLASLREVGGDAPLYFDQRAPESIASALEVLSDAEALDRMVSRGCSRAEAFGSPDTMAKRYLTLFDEVLAVRDAA
jgi:glycosyltransferase involved in cell wall biosynthesis